MRPTPVPEPLPAPRLAGRVLIVDDNADAGDLLADVLRYAGLEVTVEGQADPRSMKVGRS